MRRLWIAVAFLAAVFAATLVNSHYLKTFSTELTSLLTQAESLAERGEWSEAESLTQQALASWEEHDLYLYTMLRHSDTRFIPDSRKFLSLSAVRKGANTPPPTPALSPKSSCSMRWKNSV